MRGLLSQCDPGLCKSRRVRLSFRNQMGTRSSCARVHGWKMRLLLAMRRCGGFLPHVWRCARGMEEQQHQ